MSTSSASNTRVRFVRIQLEKQGPRAVEALVELEWSGETHAGMAEGEATATGEMRACASATIRALEAVITPRDQYSIVGIKALRVFDAELVAVLLHCAGADPPSLIGAALATESIHRASALAVLNATNRQVEKYLAESGRIE